MGRLTHRISPGWTYFVTTKCAQNVSVFQVEENAEILIAKMFEYRDKKHYLLHDFVVMPDHLHLIITPNESTSIEKAMQLIKGGSSFTIHKARGTRGEIWQSGFHESRVKDFADYQAKSDYVRFNPVAAKFVEKPGEWVFGSVNGSYKTDPIPQGLKPQIAPNSNVGPKGPTPALSARTAKP